VALVFLSTEMVQRIHEDQIQRYGGSLGIRDMGLLESAVAMPQAGFGGQYFHTDLFEMAAAYLFHLVKNHPFVDGNKRVGSMAAYAFLELNGKTFDAPEREYGDLVLAVAEGKLAKSAIAEFFRRHTG
jgi:death-on-curing protein